MRSLNCFICIVFLIVLALITEIALYPTPKTHAACVQKAKLTASDGAGSDWFGCSVAVSNDTAVVGARMDNITTNDEGSAYIFEKPQEGWASMTQTAKLTASDGEAGDYFGSSVDISSNTVVVGAYGDDVNGSFSGSAYVFLGPSSSNGSAAIPWLLLLLLGD